MIEQKIKEVVEGLDKILGDELRKIDDELEKSNHPARQRIKTEEILMVRVYDEEGKVFQPIELLWMNSRDPERLDKILTIIQAKAWEYKGKGRIVVKANKVLNF